MTEFEKKLVRVVPTQRQLAWQELEFCAFAHYGMNSFTNREWGDGSENSAIFNPANLDTDQWCASFAAAGMRGAILTAKHHDGFCLWDTKYTRHSVMYAPYGKDIVAQFAASCRKYGLKMGLYLSPWDRHEACYGRGKAYDDYFCSQLTELLRNYGDVFCVWLDGACGEGPNGKRQVYDWERYYAVVRELQPNAVLSVCGPDVRWCGNEAGACRASEWSVVSATMSDNERIKEDSQQEDSEDFRLRMPSESEDLGSREVLVNAEALIWYPAEVNTSIRPGWFYHPEEDGMVRTLDELTTVYLQSVGGNASFLLNVPPMPEGIIAPPDATRLRELGAWIRDSFAGNLLSGAKFTASASEAEHGVANLNDTARNTGLAGANYWKAPDDAGAVWIEIETDFAESPQFLVLQEELRQSQRIEAFFLEYQNESSGEWQQVCCGTVVGHRRICRLPQGISAKRWRLHIPQSRGGATLKTLALY